jgi:lipopolysaccharide export system permease protein
MLILWRFLIGHFLKVTAFCVIAFIAVLVTMRLDEIAHFASLGAQAKDIALFALYQIPYIFPIALPISCLISSMILIQRLSKTHELTALRGCGMGLKTILFPLLLTATLLAMANFYIASEVATQSHFTMNTLKSQLKAVNPLLLLHNKHLMRLKGVYFNALGPSRLGEFASDVILAVPNKNTDRIYVILAKQFIFTPLVSQDSVLEGTKAPGLNDRKQTNIKQDEPVYDRSPAGAFALAQNQLLTRGGGHPRAFIGKGVTLLSVLNNGQDEQFDPLLIENIEHSSTNVMDFGDLLQKKGSKVSGDHLQMAMLSVRLQEQREALAQARQAGKDSSVIKELRYQYHASLSEIVRRISVALAVFSFTLMGCAFGMSIGRQHSQRGLYVVIILATIFVVTFFIAKGFERNEVAAALLYLIPHGLIMGASIIFLNRISKGVEV